MLRGLALLASLSVAGCSQPATQLIVVVDTDYDVPSELDEISVAVTGPRGMRLAETEPLDGSESLPLTLAVVPESLDALGPIQVEATGRRDGSILVRREARVTLVREQTLTVLLHLLRDCEGVSCPTDETCGGNGCESIDVPVFPWTGRPPRIGEDAGSGFDGGVDAGTPDTGLDGGPRDVGIPGDTGPGCSVTGCDDSNPCTDDVCNVDGTCSRTNNAVACDDDVFCNGLDTCGGGSCSVHAGDPCTGTTCDEAANLCRGCSAAGCPARMDGAWGACGGFPDACATTGTESRVVRTFACIDDACMPSDSTESRACSRATDGIVCGATSCGPYGACDGSGCDTAGTQSRSCTDQVCSGGTCTGAPRTETAGCLRSTDGASCGATSCTGWGPCGGFADTCATTGTQTRTCTDYACSGGGCGTTMRTESQSCSRGSTDGSSCGGSSCGPYGACSFGDACTTSGSQTRTCTDYVCSGGSCTMGNRDETTGCSRGSTDGTSCGASSCDAWTACDYVGTCDENAIQTRNCTDYVCGGGTCNATGTRVESMDCFRDRFGVRCGGTTSNPRCCDTEACICCFC